ncbi:MAG: hypothetical protein D3904_11850, partial [Candidatus Electrothrix sp. EH2]|nr:hypothetical protein [Candidatus Electrothrix sp. EH2]
QVGIKNMPEQQQGDAVKHAAPDFLVRKHGQVMHLPVEIRDERKQFLIKQCPPCCGRPNSWAITGDCPYDPTCHRPA